MREIEETAVAVRIVIYGGPMRSRPIAPADDLLLSEPQNEIQVLQRPFSSSPENCIVDQPDLSDKNGQCHQGLLPDNGNRLEGLGIHNGHIVDPG